MSGRLFLGKRTPVESAGKRSEAPTGQSRTLFGSNWILDGRHLDGGQGQCSKSYSWRPMARSMGLKRPIRRPALPGSSALASSSSASCNRARFLAPSSKSATGGCVVAIPAACQRAVLVRPGAEHRRARHRRGTCSHRSLGAPGHQLCRDEGREGGRAESHGGPRTWRPDTKNPRVRGSRGRGPDRSRPSRTGELCRTHGRQRVPQGHTRHRPQLPHGQVVGRVARERLTWSLEPDRGFGSESVLSLRCAPWDE